MLPCWDSNPGPLDRRTQTLPKSYLDSLHICIFRSATWLPQCMEGNFPYGHQMIAKKAFLWYLESAPLLLPNSPLRLYVQGSWLPNFLLFFFLKCPVETSQFTYTKWQMGEERSHFQRQQESFIFFTLSLSLALRWSTEVLPGGPPVCHLCHEADLRQALHRVCLQQVHHL